MMQTTDCLTEATVFANEVDPFDDALQDLRINGSVLLHDSYAAPRAMAVPDERRLRQVLRVASDTSPMLAGVAWMLGHELDRGALRSFAASRLLELLCAEAVRAYQRDGGAGLPGWFSGLADERISEAIRRVHAAPAQSWSVEVLANTVALSPSRFAARFRERTGQSVMSYVARWRANVACHLLRDTEQSLTEIAGCVGYESLPAFSRAFKALLGQPPAAWRASRSVRRHSLGRLAPQ
jgi:AraC-like DNA-binding protein